MSRKKDVDSTSIAVIREFCKALVKNCNLATPADDITENETIEEIKKDLYKAMFEGKLNHNLSSSKH